MKCIGLDQAVWEIKQAKKPAASWDSAGAEAAGQEPPERGTRRTELSRRSGDRRVDPFFFLIGAGVSHPSIPLASKIVERCRASARRAGNPAADAVPAACRSPAEEYTDAVAAAYPQPRDQQRFLKELIHDKPVSRATSLLALLLNSRQLTRIVVTPNFDDQLFRATTRLGEQHVRVFDHPATADRLDIESDELRIVHVHGNYWSYDLCNLRGQVKRRARTGTSAAASMRRLLGRLLVDRAPLVVGYSGWEEDVLMTALRKRLKEPRPLPYHLYWFCHTPRDAEALPEWLRRSDSVSVVLTTGSCMLRPAGAPAPTDDERANDPPLTAEQVFEALLKEFHRAHPVLDTYASAATELRNLAADPGLILQMERGGKIREFMELLRGAADALANAHQDLSARVERDEAVAAPPEAAPAAGRVMIHRVVGPRDGTGPEPGDDPDGGVGAIV